MSKAIRDWQALDQEWAAEQIAKIDASDPERAHNAADSILLANAHPALVEAYNALVERCEWWTTA